jgi:phosphoribosylanthranilate isomerase
VIRRTRIKICGIRRPEDALAAAYAGADAIGLVFHEPAPRNISVEQAGQILDALPTFVTPVGVFANAEPAFLHDVVARLHLRNVQLNGDEQPDYVAGLKHLAVVKAVRVDAAFAETLRKWRDARSSPGLSNLKGVVLETGGTRQAGGTGVPNDWDAVRRHQASGGFGGLPHFIAAGGLTAQTVEAVVCGVRPWAVDVSSGVEESVGKKSAEMIAAFVEATRRADAML